MAASRTPVTPERVRKLLSAFLCDSSNNQSFEKDLAHNVLSSSDVTEDQAKDGIPEKTKPKDSNLRSREAYFDRVETFSPLSWFAKPEELSPLICAQYGWENTEVDMLRCVGCKAYLCGKLPDIVDQSGYKAACQKLKESIVSSHEKMCSWTTNPSPEWFMQVPHYDPETVRQSFQKRYKALKTHQTTLPVINYASLAKYAFDSYRCGKLTYSLENASDEGLKKATALGVAGWNISDQGSTLTCRYCQRHAGVWNFTAAEGKGDNETADPPEKRQRLENKETFDPIDEHRPFCPWVKLSQEETTLPNSLNNSQQKLDTNGQNTSISIKSPSVSHQNGSSSNPDPDLNTSQDSNTSSDSLPSPHNGESVRVKTPGWVKNLKIIAPSLLSGAGEVESLSMSIKKSPIVGLRSIRRLFRDWATPEAKNSS